MTTKPRFEVSPDIERLADYLRDRSQATYDSMSRHVNRDIKGKDRYILTSARNRLERENIVFVTKTSIGVERANHPQVASLSTSEPLTKVKRIGRRAKKRQKMVDVQSLSTDQRLAFWVGAAVLGAIEQAVTRAFKNRVKEAITEKEEPIPVKDTIDLFKKSFGSH